MSHRIRDLTKGDHPRHFLRADLEDYVLDPDTPKPAMPWTVKTRRRTSPDEMRYNQNGTLTLGDGFFAVAVTGELTSSKTILTDPPMLVQLYIDDKATGIAPGYVQMTRLGHFSKLIVVPGNAQYKLRLHAMLGMISRAALPNRAFKSGDLTIENFRLTVRALSVDPDDELPGDPDVEVAPI